MRFVALSLVRAILRLACKQEKFELAANRGNSPDTAVAAAVNVCNVHGLVIEICRCATAL